MNHSIGAWAWHHTGIVVSDLNAALEFYTATLGYEVVFEARSMTDLMESMLGLKGIRANLVQCRAPMSEQILEFIEFSQLPADWDPSLPVVPGRTHTAFLVPDLDRAVEETIAQGGRLIGSITEFSEGRAAYCIEPGGTVVEWEEARP